MRRRDVKGARGDGSVVDVLWLGGRVVGGGERGRGMRFVVGVERLSGRHDGRDGCRVLSLSLFRFLDGLTRRFEGLELNPRKRKNSMK